MWNVMAMYYVGITYLPTGLTSVWKKTCLKVAPALGSGPNGVSVSHGELHLYSIHSHESQKWKHNLLSIAWFSESQAPLCKCILLDAWANPNAPVPPSPFSLYHLVLQCLVPWKSRLYFFGHLAGTRFNNIIGCNLRKRYRTLGRGVVSFFL